MRRHPPRLFDRQPRAVPVNSFRRAHQQYAKLVDPFADLIHHQPLTGLQVPILAGKFVQAQHRVVARVIGIVASRPITHLTAFGYRQKIRD